MNEAINPMVSLVLSGFHGCTEECFPEVQCIEQKVLIKSSVSTVHVAGPNLSSSLSLFSSMSLFKHFCVEAESDVDDLTNVQLIELAFQRLSLTFQIL